MCIRNGYGCIATSAKTCLLYMQEVALAGNARLAGIRGADQSTVLMVGPSYSWLSEAPSLPICSPRMLGQLQN
jgi:hypothetical protein